MLQRLFPWICILLSVQEVAAEPWNVTFCLNNGTISYHANASLAATCTCDSPYDGAYCQVNTTLGPIIITSAALSLLACLVQFYFRCKFRQFSQWPNYIVYSRSVIDFMFSLHLIILQGILLKFPNSIVCSLSTVFSTNPGAGHELDGTCNDPDPCTYFSFVFQFTLVGSLLWFGFGSYDYWKTISDPFVHPSTYKWTYTAWVLIISIASAGFGISDGVKKASDNNSNQLYREGMQACWTSVQITTTSINKTNIFTMYIWLGLALAVAMLVGAIGEIKMKSKSEGTSDTLSLRRKAIGDSRAQLLAFLAFWMVWGALYALRYFGTDTFGGSFSWTSYYLMGLLPLNGFVNAVVWLINNRKEIIQAYKVDNDDKSRGRQRTKSLQDAHERDMKRGEDQNDMSQALKKELLGKIAEGIKEVLGKNDEFKYNNDSVFIDKLIGRPPTHREKVWRDEQTSRWCPKFCRCPAVDQARDVEFIEHRPNAFKYLRESCYGVSDAEYLASFASLGDQKLSGGKSGALFFSTPDSKYLVKTLEPGSLFKRSELGVLLEVIDSYCVHMTPRSFRQQSLQQGQRLGCNSLITKIFGCYTLKIYGQKLEFYVMEKLDPESASLKVTERYDLKGSWVSRLSKKAGTGKDQNFQGQTINLAPSLAQDIFMQSVNDVHFFEKNKIMDYSLLLAVHRCRDARIRDKHCTFGKSHAELGEVHVHVTTAEEKHPALGTSLSTGKVAGGQDEKGQLEMDEFVRTTSSVPVHKKFEGGMQSAFMEGPGVYFMGIIDPLQKWDCSKICESYLKRYLLCNGIGISAVPPPLFATRFLLMMLKSLAVSLASLASLNQDYLDSYGIEGVEIINHKQDEQEEFLYLLQLTRKTENLKRSGSVSGNPESHRRTIKEEASLVACEAWEPEATIISEPQGYKMVTEYRIRQRLGSIGTKKKPETAPSVFGKIVAPITFVGDLLANSVRGSISPVDGEEDKRERASIHRSSSRLALSGVASPKGSYIPPPITPTSAASPRFLAPSGLSAPSTPTPTETALSTPTSHSSQTLGASQ